MFNNSNPFLKLNHIFRLKHQLEQFKNIPFYGDCELKDIEYVPKGTFLVKPHRILEVLSYIRKNNKQAPYSNKREVVNLLNQAVKNGENVEIQKTHVNNIKEMLGKNRIFE